MKTFTIHSGDWQTDVEVSEDVFETYDSQAQEAIALGLEEWVRDEDDTHVGLFTSAWVKSKSENDLDAYVMHNKYAFENIGRLDLAGLFEDTK